MNEVKSPKKPMLYYYAMALLVLLLINFLAVPWLSQRQVKEVDYGTFMTMTENKEIGRVEVPGQPDPLHKQRRHPDLQDRPDGRS